MSYGAELSSAWADHLAPRKPDAPTVVSTFAGCGGSSLGYSMAGYRELLAVEWDDHAVDVFKRNFPDIPMHHGDITDVDPAVIGLAPGELDVLDGSPPCQGFSTAGSRRIEDPRNDLFRQYVRLLGAWQPRAFIMENVTGLVKGRMRLKFVEILDALKSAGPGYAVTARVLNASMLNVPQARQRLIVIGMRNDLDVTPRHPLPVTRPLSVRDAWADLDHPGEAPRPDPKYKNAALIPHIGPGQTGADALKAAGRKAMWFGISRLAWDRPAPTILRSFDKAAATGFLHPRENRWVGVRELSRLHSIPDEYDWGPSSYAQIHWRIGNSVPPLMMRAVAGTVRDLLDEADAK